MSHARKEYKDFMTLAPDAYAAVLALGQVGGARPASTSNCSN